MISVEEELQKALVGSHVAAVRGVASYQGVQTALQLEQSGSITFNGSRQIQSAGDCTVVGSRTASLVPSASTDPLAPFGQELTLWREVLVRDRSWNVPLGVYRISAASDSSERFRGDVAVDWSVKVDFLDRLKLLADDDFLAPEGPQGGSVWDEVRRLSPLPVQEALGDAVVPAGTVYESRAAAVDVLLGLLGGVPQITRQGVLTARLADRWLSETSPDVTIRGVIKLSTSMRGDFFNQVIVSNPNDPLISATASISDPSNPLSVQRAGGRTYKHSSPLYTTLEEAQAAAETILARVSTKRARMADVTCTPEAMLLELGDVAMFVDVDRRVQLLGEVASLSVSLNPTDPVRLSVIEISSEPASPEVLASVDGLYGNGLYGLGVYGGPDDV